MGSVVKGKGSTRGHYGSEKYQELMMEKHHNKNKCQKEERRS